MTARPLDITRAAERAGKPLAIDLFAGLGGWTSGLLAEGWQVVGIDIEEHVYGEHRYPAGLIIQDVLTVDGRAFSGAGLIVASPPCQFFSYCAMPWSRAKALAAKVRADVALIEKELALFNACFRIQAEASAAARRHVPMVVENVRGAIPWVGRSRWNFGSFHLWGDVPALMPATFKLPPKRAMDDLKYGQRKLLHSHLPVGNGPLGRNDGTEQDGRKLAGFRFDGSGRSFQSASVEHTGVKAPGMNWSDRTKGPGQNFTRIAGRHAARDPMWARGFTATAADQIGDGIKCGGGWFGDNNPSAMRHHSSKSPKRKAASAMIAKIPEPLARWIARAFHPGGLGATGEAA